MAPRRNDRPEWDTEWMNRAKCRGVDPALFFPEKGDNFTKAEAVRICARCPVQAECRDYGMQEREGIWGGMSNKDRRRYRRNHAPLHLVSNQ